MDNKISVGIVFSAFDLFHSGHVMMLRDAKKKCDHLIAGVHVDPSIERLITKNKPIQSLFERTVQVQGCRYVDEVITYATEDDLYKFLKYIKPDIRFLGQEYIGMDFTGKDIEEIKISYIDRSHGYSSSELRGRVINSAEF